MSFMTQDHFTLINIYDVVRIFATKPSKLEQFKIHSGQHDMN